MVGASSLVRGRLDDFRVSLRTIANHFYVPLEIAMLAQRAFGEKVREAGKSFVVFFRREKEVFGSSFRMGPPVHGLCVGYMD